VARVTAGHRSAAIGAPITSAPHRRADGYVEGSMPKSQPDIRQVAARAGVSVGTVSNVLNRPDAVADATMEAVLRAIDELGYVRNGSASRLRSARSNIVGLIVLDAANPFFTEVARGAEEELADQGYSVVVCKYAKPGLGELCWR
jgi:DNA-binding LacI/PurR family transcriptional regulator